MTTCDDDLDSDDLSYLFCVTSEVLQNYCIFVIKFHIKITHQYYVSGVIRLDVRIHRIKKGINPNLEDNLLLFLI